MVAPEFIDTDEEMKAAEIKPKGQTAPESTGSMLIKMMTNLNDNLENFTASVANISMKMDAIESSQKTVADAVKTIENQQGELKNKADDIPTSSRRR